MIIVQTTAAFSVSVPNTLLIRIRESNGRKWVRRIYLGEDLQGAPDEYKVLKETDDINEAIQFMLDWYDSNLASNAKEFHFFGKFVKEYEELFRTTEKRFVTILRKNRNY